MQIGRAMRAVWAAAAALIFAFALAGSALAVTPEQYMNALGQNVEAYSGTRSWSRVAGQLQLDEAGLSGSEGGFAILADGGSLTTDAAHVSISGDVQDGSIVRLQVNITPSGDKSHEYEYQAFSLSEIAFESLLSKGVMSSDMCAYLFVYDVYPYAMWASDSVLGNNSRQVTTALGDVLYDIAASSSGSDMSIQLTVDVLGSATAADIADARENLHANYAFEAICSLVYELEVCKNTCVAMLRAGDADSCGELLGDMRACAQEYYALGADGYDKLAKLTGLLTPQFGSMLTAIDALENGVDEAGITALEDSVDSMMDAFRSMY